MALEILSQRPPATQHNWIHDCSKMDNPMWKNSVLSTAEFIAFVINMEHDVVQQNDPSQQSLSNIVPVIAAKLHWFQVSLNAQRAQLQRSNSKIGNDMAAPLQRIHALETGSVNLSISLQATAESSLAQCQPKQNDPLTQAVNKSETLSTV